MTTSHPHHLGGLRLECVGSGGIRVRFRRPATGLPLPQNAPLAPSGWRPAISPPDPPPAAAPNARALAMATLDIPTAGTASEAVSVGISIGKYFVFSAGIETDMDGSP